MGRRKKPEEAPFSETYSPKARSMEAREGQLTALAYDLVERRLREGTATSQETVHFLRMGSSREKEELQILKKKCELMENQIEALKSAKRVEEMYADAISAVTSYRSSVPMTGASDDQII